MNHIPNMHVYNSERFIDLNRDKADEIITLEIKSSEKIKAQIILGVVGSKIKSPFSAPFGGPDINSHISYSTIKDLIDEIQSLSSDRSLPVEITFPPLFYNSELEKVAFGILNTPGIETMADINYHIGLCDRNEYLNRINRSARKNLNQAWKNNLTTILVPEDDIATKQTVYDILWQNRNSKGRELRMTFAQLQDTSSVVQIDYFLMKRKDKPIAAAVCYHVADGIVQVIYWGHLPESSHTRPMNQLAYDIFNHYHEHGIKIVDVGPASLDGTPDEGLCDFKESIGCVPTLKYRFRINPSTGINR